MTSHEIEDVLSSIRRLVSEDLRPAVPRPDAEARPVAPAPVASTAAAAPRAADKLILTPALRIVGRDEGEAAVAEPPPAEDPAAVADGPVPEAARTESPVHAVASRLTLSDVAPPAAPPVDALADLSGGEPAPDHIEWREDVWGRAAAAPTLEETAENEAEIATVPAAADTVPEAPMWLGVEQAEVWGDQTTDWVEEEPIPFAPHQRRPASVQEPDPQPRQPDPLASAWADQAEAAVRAELEAGDAPQPATAEIADDDGPDLFAEETGAIDEEMLRAIVRDIIREELAGTLGERITRNVRKLVRVEINRALATRDFE